MAISINSSIPISITSDGIAAGVAQNDFETGSNSFTYAIQASSDGSNFGDAVDVTLTDIDDNTPVTSMTTPTPTLGLPSASQIAANPVLHL